MDVVAWVLEGVLAALFLLHGLVYAVPGWDRAMVPAEGTRPIPVPFQRFIGVAEVAAAVGLVVPPLVHVAVWLAPVAASGLVIVMLGATGFHARRRELPMVGVTLLLCVLAAVVAWLRFVVVPFS